LCIILYMGGKSLRQKKHLLNQLFCVHSYSSQDKNVDQGFLFIYDKHSVEQSYEKVCYKIIFINNQFSMQNLYAMILRKNCKNNYFFLFKLNLLFYRQKIYIN